MEIVAAVGQEDEILQQVGGQPVGHQRRPLALQVEQFRGRVLGGDMASASIVIRSVASGTAVAQPLTACASYGKALRRAGLTPQTPRAGTLPPLLQSCRLCRSIFTVAESG